MDTIKIQGTDDTPTIVLDAEKNVFEIAGRSLPEDVNAFYNPILEWLEQYKQNPNEKTIFGFKLTYFNTASSKLLLDILMKLLDIHESGKEVMIKWYYEEDDEDMFEAGEEYDELVDIPFELITWTSTV